VDNASVLVVHQNHRFGHDGKWVPTGRWDYVAGFTNGKWEYYGTCMTKKEAIHKAVDALYRDVHDRMWWADKLPIMKQCLEHVPDFPDKTNEELSNV
jgi:hypothetical protein